jgi:DNA polymerase-3 subunit gamma/tau
VSEPAPASPAQQPVSDAAAPPSGGLTVVDARRLWPDVIQALAVLHRPTWVLLSSHGQVVDLQGQTLTIGFTTVGLREQFVSGGREPHLRQAIVNVIGAEWRIEAIVDPGAQPSPPAGGATSRAAVPDQTPRQQQTPPQPVPQSTPEQPRPPVAERPSPDQPPWDQAPPPEPPPWDEPDRPGQQTEPVENRPDSRAIDAARGAIQPTRRGGRAVDTTTEDLRAADAHAHPDDLDADTDNLGGAALLERELGAQIIEEIRHQ